MGRKANRNNKQEHLTNRQQKRQQQVVRKQLRKQKERRQYGDATWRSDLAKFNTQLGVQGLKVKDVAGDGNCMFRAICDQIEGTPDNHAHYRRVITDYMVANRFDFEPFYMGEDENSQTYEQYVAMMKRNGSWGGNLELQAASMALGVNIVVHQLEQARWEVVNYRQSDARTISLSYHTGDHYASVRALDGSRGTARAVTASGSATPTWSAMPTAAAFESDEPNWQEAIVMRATDATLAEARNALLENYEDTDGAVNYLLALKFSLADSVLAAPLSPLATPGRQQLTASGGVLSIPVPDESAACASTSSATTTTRQCHSRTTSSEQSRGADDDDDLDAGWATAQRGRAARKPLSGAEKLAKAAAKAPPEHVSNAARKRQLAREKKKQTSQQKAAQRSADDDAANGTADTTATTPAPTDDNYEPMLVATQALAI